MAVALLSALFACSSVALASVGGQRAAASAGQLEGVLFEREADAYSGGMATKAVQPSYYIATRDHVVSLSEAQPESFVGQLVVVSDTNAAEKGVRGQVHLIHPEQHLLAAPSPGPQTALVILITTPDDPTPAASDPEAARSVIFTDPESTGAYYAQQSNGATTLTGRVNPSGDVVGPVALNTPMTGCPTEAIANEADSRASALGYSPNAYDHVIYILPHSSECAWGGIGDLPGPRSWSNGYLFTSLLAHELGHNMGAHHANSLACTDASGNPVSYSATCTSVEYGDPFDVMGISRALMGAFHRLQVGELPQERVDRLRESTSVGLTSSEGFASPGPRLVLVPIKHPHVAVTEYFAIDSRSPLAPFDSWGLGDPVSTGLTIRKVVESSYAQTQLLNMHPGGSVAESPLQPGETFSDPADSITISASSSPSGQLQASVAMPPLPLTDDVPPTPPPWFSVSSTSTMAHLSWLAGTDDVAVSHYRILRNGVDLGTSSGLSFDDPTVQALTQATYSVITVDTSGNESIPISLTITIPHQSFLSPEGESPEGNVKSSRSQARSILVYPQLKRGRHGRLLVSLHCAAVSTCKGTVKLSIRTHGRQEGIGKASYNVRAGGTVTVYVSIVNPFVTIARRHRSTMRAVVTLNGGRTVSRVCYLSAVKR